MRATSICFKVGLVLFVMLGVAQVCQASSEVKTWGYYWKGKSAIFVPVSPPPVLNNPIAMVGGAGHSMALQANGSVIAWGDDTFNQSAVPPGLSGVIAIASGDYHSLALRANGTVRAWGDNSSGQTDVPPGLTNVVAIAAGFAHSLALRADGTVVGWGSDNVGEVDIPLNVGNVIAISSANVHSLALRADGTVVAWGNNFFGELNVPLDLTNAVAIAAGAQHNIALTADGRVVGWGDGSFGATTTPAGLSNIIAIAAGGVHSLAMLADGSVVAWGGGKTVDPSTGGDYGQSIVPGNLTNVAAVAGGYIQSLALQRDDPPVAVEPVLNRTVLNGGTAWLRVPTSGAQPLHYQWNFNGRSLPDGTNALLTLNNLTLAQEGVYSLLVSNQYGVAISSNFTVSVAPLFITQQPRTQVAFVGSQVALQVSVSGQGPFSYQWQVNGVDIPGASNNSFVMPHIWTYDAGTYSVVISNVFGTVRSSNAVVTVTQVKQWAGTFGMSNVPPATGNLIAISAGRDHCLALKDDGTVGIWGSANAFGQLNAPPGLTNVIGISANFLHSLALRADGKVFGWGWNDFGQCTVPAGVSNLVSVSAGILHSLGLRSDGTVVAWGSAIDPNGIWPNLYKAAVVPNTLTNAVAIAAGRDWSLALKADGTVVGWGNGDLSVMTIPENATNVIAIAAGREHWVALRRDGTLVMWGNNFQGQLNIPPDVTNVVAISAGEYFTMGLKADSTVTAWGDNAWGQLSVPVGLTNVAMIAAGTYGGFAVVQTGPPSLGSLLVNVELLYGGTFSLHAVAYGAKPFTYQWMYNGTDIPGATNASITVENLQFENAGHYSVMISNPYGTMVSSNMTLTVSPLMISGQPKDVFTYRGATVALAVSVQSGLPVNYQWQFHGTDVDGATNSELVLPNAQLSDAGRYSVSVSNALGGTLSQSANVEIGQVIAWGDNTYGQTALPHGLTNIVMVEAGDYHNLALRSDGTVVAWGQNLSAAAGPTNVPVGLSNVVSISAGGGQSIALREDGSVVAWGQTTVPPVLTNATAIAAGSTHALALKSDGTVVAWGNDSFGQTDVPTGLTNVTAIAAGSEHSLALKSDGTVTVWGANEWGQLDVPAGLTNVIAVASGYQHCLALRSDGTMVVWGAYYNGATNMPAGISNVIAISAGGHHNIGLRDDRTLVSWGDGIIGQAIPPLFATNLVMIAAGVAHNVAIVDSLWPLVVSLSPKGPHINSILTRQDLRVYNRSPFIYPSIRILIRHLPASVGIGNAAGLTAAGEFYVQSGVTLEPGNSTKLNIDYLTDDGKLPAVKLDGEVVSNPVVSQPIVRSAWQGSGGFLLEFNTSINSSYFVQYSSDLTNWRTVSTLYPGDGATRRWVDLGPPLTQSSPATQGQRFYRVMVAPFSP